MMKTLKNLVSLVCVLSTTLVFAQIQAPQPSSAGSVSATVGLTEIKIDYFRPKMNDRKIFGEGGDFLQPFGQLWRTGANSGSKLTLSTDATIGGKEVKAGTYLIFSTPGKDSWDFRLYADLSLGGNVNGYDESKEVLRTSVKPIWTDRNTETLTFNISDISSDNKTANIELAWANVLVKVPIKVEFHDQVMKEIAAKTQVNPGNYTAAANYYLTTGENLEQALKWMDMYLSVPGNEKQFWHVHTKAKIQAALGMTKEAIATATDSMTKAKANPNGDFGYVKNNEELIASLKKK